MPLAIRADAASQQSASSGPIDSRQIAEVENDHATQDPEIEKALDVRAWLLTRRLRSEDA
ncbi:hypothetical protein ACWD5F_44610 [Streptomyces sp. NPDC002499]